MMDFNWVDWTILGIVGVSFLFGLTWGVLRIFFFGLSLWLTLELLPLTIPLFEKIIVPILGGENLGNSMQFFSEILVIGAAICLPFLLLSILLSWPYYYIIKYLNPFMNFGIGTIVGIIIGYIFTVALAILAAYGSVDRPKPLVVCQSLFAPFVYNGTKPLLQLGINATAELKDIQQFLKELRPGLESADPSNPATCGNEKSI